jgi:hypothetical protein
MKSKLITDNKRDPNNYAYTLAIDFFIKKLITDVALSITRIDIRLVDNLFDEGECFLTKLKNSKSVVTIKIRQGMSFIKTVQAIAHEFVHAAQFISKRLRISRDGSWVWDGKNYGDDPYKGLSEDEIYNGLPWEIEASYQENDLLLEFVDYYLEGNS